MPKDNPADTQLRGTLTTYLDRLLSSVDEYSPSDQHKGPRHPYIRLVHREAERLLKVIRDAVREEVRAQPGRAQRGNLDAAVRAITPKVAKRLRV